MEKYKLIFEEGLGLLNQERLLSGLVNWDVEGLLMSTGRMCVSRIFTKSVTALNEITLLPEQGRTRRSRMTGSSSHGICLLAPKVPVVTAAGDGN